MPPNHQLQTSLHTGFNFSQSSLQDYIDCARRFQLRYMEQLQWPAVETAPILENEQRALAGQQFHLLVQRQLIGLPAASLARHAAGEPLSRWWQNWLEFRESTSLGEIYPEVSLSAPAGKMRLLAKFDLVSVQAGRAIIYDWKTYHKRPRDADMTARMQSRVYPALLVLAGAHLNGGLPFAPGQVEMVYWYAEFPSEPCRIAYTEERFKKDWDEIQARVDEISAKQSFPPTEDERKCAYCAYRSYCERGVAAGQSEAEETTPAVLDVDLEQIQEIEF